MNDDTTTPTLEPQQRKQITIRIRSKEEAKLKREFDRIRARKTFLQREFAAIAKGEVTAINKMVDRGMLVDADGNPVGQEPAPTDGAPGVS